MVYWWGWLSPALIGTLAGWKRPRLASELSRARPRSFGQKVWAGREVIFRMGLGRVSPLRCRTDLARTVALVPWLWGGGEAEVACGTGAGDFVRGALSGG